MVGFYVRLCKACMKADLQSCNDSKLTSVESRESVRFYNNRSSFCTLSWGSKLQNQGCFFGDLPLRFTGSNNTTRGSVSLSLSFLRLAATSDLDAKWMLLETVAKHFFSLCARHVIQKCFYHCFSKSSANMLGKKTCSLFFLFFLLFFLMTSVSLNISNEIQSFHCLKELHLRCFFLNCVFSYLQWGYCCMLIVKISHQCSARRDGRAERCEKILLSVPSSHLFLLSGWIVCRSPHYKTVKCTYIPLYL